MENEAEEEIVITGYPVLDKILRWFNGSGSPLDDILKLAYIDPLVATVAEELRDVLPADEIQKITTSARNIIPAIFRKCFEYGVVNLGAVAYVLATAEHETDYWRDLEEQEEPGSDPVEYFSDKYANLYGNGDKASRDGYIFRGQGLVHVTFRDNYGKFMVDTDPSNITNLKNFAQYVEEEYRQRGNSKVAQRLDIATQVLVQGMQEGYFQKDKNNPGRGTDYLDKYFIAGKNPTQSDFIAARIIVNDDANAPSVAIPTRQETKGQKIARRADTYLQKLKSFAGSR
ncbi:hypothetical protein K9N68_38400 (plasmid) [Kovacikia minuta CCNUW1]|uniref:hypothetical protein n=1 Tax=Kovacikia minuta TaxID=2931930 RepID=UPI001CCD57EB|nr:hypothetical protein [Kovacikia minuta]UBF30063.1 hypothetical protein K9N68_38400 [Kovacikia minuta CCNUW1]